MNASTPITRLRRDQEFTVNLFPIGQRTNDGRRIWETQAELDPMFTYMLMLGGPDAPGVNEAFNGKVAEPPPKNVFDPLKWNSYRIQIINEDSTTGWSTAAQRFTLN